MKTLRAAHSLAFILSASLLLAGTARAEGLSDREKKRKELNAKFDKLHLRQKTAFVVDRSDEFLKQPAGVTIEGEFSVAKVAPTVKLQILPHLEPEYFTGADQYMACWANWGYMSRSEDNRFFIPASDHLAKGCHINLYEYHPDENAVKRVLEVGKLLGWKDDSYTDGKIHGHMGIMPDGTLWAATHFGVQPKKEWYESGYRGSWLFSYNIHTGKAKNWGVPLVGNALPCYTLDPRRGRFVGTGYKLTMLCWDCNTKQVRFAGYPPNGWTWWRRTMLCDEETGKFWGMDGSEVPYHLMSFDPELNRFERHEVLVPAHPSTKKNARLRGHTDRPAMDGWYYWATLNGTLFRFRPEGAKGPEVEPLGVTWDKGRDTLQFAIGPTGRYIYYQPKGYPSPVVQYDVKTGKKKALCFLQDYYFEKYGYWLASQVYGMHISKDGSFLVICMNGTFAGKNKSFGHPALAVVSVPPEERPVE